ncbi:hypothetical protein V6N13_109156 [Hibiscus sabdariffa]
MKHSDFPFTNKNKKRTDDNPHFLRKKPKTLKKSALVEVKSFDVPVFSSTSASPVDSLCLEPDRPYTIGRANASCDFTLGSRFVSKQHCQILYDSVDRKIFILDGTIFSDDFSFIISEFRRRFLFSDDELEEKEKAEEVLGFCKVRVPLNGVYVNGIKVKRGRVRELFAGDEVLLVCGNESKCSLLVRVGFVIQGIVFKEEMVSGLDEVTGMRPRPLGEMVSSRHSQGTVSSGKRNKRVFAIPANEMSRGWDKGLKSSDVMGRAKFILNQCRSILHSDDPIACIRQSGILACGQNKFLGFTSSDRMKFAIGSEEEVSSIFPLCRKEPQSSNKKDKPVQSGSFREVVNSELNHDLIGDALPSDLPCTKVTVECSGVDVTANDRCGMSLLKFSEKENIPNIDGVGISKIPMNFCSAPGKMFYLNRLSYSDCGSSSHDSVVSLHELLYPVESISNIFIATFTSDISWFLLHCEIPCHLPVTVACHNAERCWSSSPDARTTRPFPDFPNLVVVFPPFPEAIAFGNDLKKRGIACHHPKLLVLQREDSIRVVITSANLVAKQWESVTNTVWWQDFPRRREPDYLSLFSLSHGELRQDSRSDFAAQLAGFMACLIVDVPSQSHWIVELANYEFTNAMGYLVASIPGIHSDRALKANQFTLSSLDMKFLGLVEASVVGLSHLFRTTADRKGAQLKKLALFLGKTCENANGMLNVVLRRDTNIPVDENAVSVLVPNPDKLSARGAKIFRYVKNDDRSKYCCIMLSHCFSSEVYRPLETSRALYSCLFLNNFQVSSMIVESAFLVLGQYNWPESEESDFVYGSFFFPSKCSDLLFLLIVLSDIYHVSPVFQGASSIGSSISAPFLAAFAASVGKKSIQCFDSEESDPQWGCWTASQELRNPSIRIIFPTIERVKSACSGISPSRRLLCFSEKTWQRLRNVGILHDAIPSPSNRVGHPMHVKVARRRFWSTKSSSSFGWIYCGSHNFSAAAWGRPISSSARTKANGLVNANSFITSRLHICNYELGIIFLFPPTETKCIANQNQTKLDDVPFPFVVPAPKYGPKDRPATAQAMRDALAELSEREANRLAEVEITENMMEDVPDEDEEVIEATNYVVEEKEEDKTYAEKLWSQVDSSQSS